MKKKIKDSILCLFVLLLGMLLLSERTAVTQSISSALSMCSEILIPSLFPFMVLSSLAVKTGAFLRLGKIFSPLMKKIFALSGECFSCLFFGFTGGYPVGLNIISSLYEKGRISRNDVKHMAAFCVNAGPAFAVTAAGEMMLSSKKAGFVILASVCIASLITGIVYGLFKKKNEYGVYEKKREIQFSQALTEAVNSSSGGMLSICVWVIVFSAFSALVSLFVKNETLRLVYLAFSEVTSGIVAAAKLGGIELVSASIAFGGFCVMLQLLPYIKKCGMKAGEYLLFRTTNAVLSYFITKIILIFVEIPTDVFGSFYARPWSFTAPSSAVLLIMCAVLIFDTAAGKTGRLFDDIG